MKYILILATLAALSFTTYQAIQVDGVSLSGDGTLSTPLAIPTTYIDSGVYTPSTSGNSNLDSYSASNARYFRIGDQVTVIGSVTLDPTTTLSATRLELQPPIASDLTASTDCSGVAYTASGEGIQITANITDNNPQFTFSCLSTSSQSFSYVYSYIVQ